MYCCFGWAVHSPQYTRSSILPPKLSDDGLGQHLPNGEKKLQIWYRLSRFQKTPGHGRRKLTSIDLQVSDDSRQVVQELGSSSADQSASADERKEDLEDRNIESWRSKLQKPCKGGYVFLVREEGLSDCTV